ncbi:MAG: glutathione binding-like protein [Acidobacteriota bacterium]
MTTTKYRLFSWEHSYFSGKVRAYLRYKQAFDGLGPGFEDVLATPEILQKVLGPATGSPTVPQLCTPEGAFVQDSSEIIDVVEERHPGPSVLPSAESAPRQRLACFLLELLADEWMIVYAFWERWQYSREGISPSHLDFNALQWGAFLEPRLGGAERRLAGQALFDKVFSREAPSDATAGPYAGLRHLGVDDATEPAWQASNLRLLERLEAHFAAHDYVLGGRPSLADFALLGPLYAHQYRDAVAGFILRTRFPLIAEWVERCNATNALNARAYDQVVYSVDEEGELVETLAQSDGGEWLPRDQIPETLAPVIEVFFEEMWPVLESTVLRVREYLSSGQRAPGGELPARSFSATPGFETLQTGEGALTHDFTLGDVTSRRMVLPHHVWRLQRLAAQVSACVDSDEGLDEVASWLEAFARGDELLELEELLAGARLRKIGGRLFVDDGGEDLLN